MPRMPSSMVYIRSTRPWWYTSKMTPRPASHTYSSPCMSVRRMKLSTTGVDEQSTPRHTPYPQASPPYRTNNTDPHQQRPDNNHQDQMHYCRQDNNNSPNVTIHTTQVEPTMEIQTEEDYIPPYIDYDNAPQDRDDVEMTFYTEVYAAAIRMADDTEWQDNHCYNCKEKGHFWHQCTKPLKEEFQWLLDHPKQRDNELNKKGGPRAKGG